MITPPLVSCIMPTCNRRAFVPRAIEYFLRQDYPNRELLILDDGSDPVNDLIPADERIRYTRLSRKLTVGAKRNLACEQASGEIIAHWDDDDWHAPHRLRYQVEALVQANAEVCGINILLFYDIVNQRAWQYTYPPHQRFWLSGSSLCYTRSFWARHPFPKINIGEDTRFVWSGSPDRMLALPDYQFHVGIIHPGNISPKQTSGSYWIPYPRESIHQLLGEDWHDAQPSVQKPPILPDPGKISSPPRIIDMITTAQQSHLLLPEFAAFNQGQSLPRMRRWEQPFVLFQGHFGDTMSVLDCTINPANFRERLLALYPHTYYLHKSPIQNGQFVLPIGAPDNAFDRVICINTFEHLLSDQRQALMAALARKLKPGGWLLLTSDYYFESSWQNPDFLNSGLLRADRQEVFNGFNRITPAEWQDLCARNDLHPLGPMIEPPQEGDADLYLQQPPHVHASMGGVFVKEGQAAFSAGKKIVLGLLTWNTCVISLEAVRAYIQEARMLRRLGQEPSLCICDNGSSDGTPAALESLAGECDDIPYHLILNRENLGSSIARNQMIAHLLGIQADYLLFMDGDIEIVPFSSFAMLRYMENQGCQLGSLGAHSHWQTPLREKASMGLYSVANSSILTTNLVAWTQFGLFRREVFEAGVRFDENDPFDRAGWGFEDNDLAFQMDVKGFTNQCFSGMTYLHRNVHSSLGILRQNGYDPAQLYQRRKQYLVDKWAATPHINNGPLADVRRVEMPRG